MDSDYKVRLATLQAMGGDMTKNYPSVYDVDLAILSYVQQSGGGVSQEYVDQQDNAVKEWVSGASYITASDLPDLSTYVSKSELSAAAYITSADLPDYSNTYQAKGDYITPEILSAQSYLTTETDPVFTASAASGISREDLAKWNNTATYLNSYVSKSELDAAAYVTTNTLENSEFAISRAINDLEVNKVSYTALSAMSYATTTYVNTYFGKIVTLTQAQYDALAVKDPMTIYIISDAQ